ncbi:MAG: hypothetical protein DRP70_04500 [Spirochaetes bacterium]|nr:MAG: hypothetical protein DRP70_04500 [Spirochaetota bacterium]RKX98798.1 MAG: hypothetical protein DRZ90_01495 [Spirochaetota bacterium]
MKASFTAVILILSALNLCANEDNSIPRRIRFELEITEGAPEYLSMTAEILFAEIAARNTVIPIEHEDGRVDLIHITADDSKLTFSLTAEGTDLLSESFSLVDLTNLEDLETACSQVAEVWASYLGLIEPDVQELVVRQERKMTDEIALERSLASPFQMVLYSPAFRVKPFTSNSYGGSHLGLMPIVFDFQWFINSNIGISFSMYLEYSSFYQFGESDTNEQNLFLLPGIGFIYRTIGRLSGEFSAGYYFGPVQMTAGGDIPEFALLAGDVIWITTSMLDFHLALSWNFTNRFSIKMKTGLSFLIDNRWGSYNSEPVVMVQLGSGYRW